MRRQSIIKQLNSFYLQLLDGSLSLSSPAIALYVALVMKSNFAAYRQFGDFFAEYDFKASEQDLKLLSGLSKGTIRKARDELKENDLIHYRKGRSFGEDRKPTASVYSIVYLKYHRIRLASGSSIGEEDSLGQIWSNSLGQILPSVNASTGSNLVSNKEYLKDIYKEQNTNDASLPEQNPDLGRLSAIWFSYLSEKGIILTSSQLDRHLKKMSAALKDYGPEKTRTMIDIAIENGWTSIHYETLAKKLVGNAEAQAIPESFLH